MKVWFDIEDNVVPNPAPTSLYEEGLYLALIHTCPEIVDSHGPCYISTP